MNKRSTNGRHERPKLMTDEQTQDAMEKLRSFATLVADMRHVQRDYFRLRSPSTLDRAKQLERRVDKACKAVLEEQQQQGNLF